MTHLHIFALTVALILLNGCGTAPMPEQGYLVGDWVATSVRDGQGQALNLADGSKYLIEISRGWLRLYEVGGKNEKMLGNSQPYQLDNNRITIEPAGKGTSAYEAKVHTLTSKELVLKNFRIDAKHAHSEIRLKRIEPKVALSLYNGKPGQGRDNKNDNVNKDGNGTINGSKSNSKSKSKSTEKVTEQNPRAKSTISGESLAGVWLLKGLLIDGKSIKPGEKLPSGGVLPALPIAHEFLESGEWVQYVGYSSAGAQPFDVAENKLQLGELVANISAYDEIKGTITLGEPHLEAQPPTENILSEYERISLDQAGELFWDNEVFSQIHAEDFPTETDSLDGYWVSESYVYAGKEYKYGEVHKGTKHKVAMTGSLVMHLQKGKLQCYFNDGKQFKTCSKGYISYRFEGQAMLTSNLTILFKHNALDKPGAVETLITTLFLIKTPDPLYESMIFHRATKEEAVAAIGANPNYKPE